MADQITMSVAPGFPVCRTGSQHAGHYCRYAGHRASRGEIVMWHSTDARLWPTRADGMSRETVASRPWGKMINNPFAFDQGRDGASFRLIF